MPRSSTAIIACAAGAAFLSQQAFVPGPRVANRAPVAAVAGSIAALGAAPAFADEIGEAARKLSSASYPFLKEVDWNSFVYLVKPGSGSAIDWLKAIDKAIVMGASMDSDLLKRGVLAHSAAIKRVDANGLISLQDYTDINAAIGRMIASTPEDQVMDVYYAFDKIVPKEAALYQYTKVNQADGTGSADADAAYKALMEFKDVVKAHPIIADSVSAFKIANMKKDAAGYVMRVSEDGMKQDQSAGIGGITGTTVEAAITAAAKKLSAASYPFIQDVDWTSDIFAKPLPGVEAQKALKAVDKALIMGADMNPKLLKAAALAHHNAIASIDAKGVTSAADYEAINVALGKLVASVPTNRVLDVFKAFAGLTKPEVGNNMFNLVDAGDAVKAYSAFWEFKDVVKFAQFYNF